MRYDVIIVGAGIAGFTAAIYVRRAGKSVLVLEAEVPGGQIINTLNIENWPGNMGASGVELMQKIQEQATELGAVVEMEEVVGIKKQAGEFVVATEDEEYQAKAVILAVGAKNRMLGLEREEELTGRGVSYCATCDGAFYKGKSVAVIGGGNTALDDALYLADIAAKVYLVHRRNEFRGDEATVSKLRKRDNVEFVTPYVPEEFLGDNKVTGIKVKMVDSDDVRAGDKYRFLEVDGVFVAIGQEPATEAFAELVDLDEKGYIVAGEDCRTSCLGIFAVGDCRMKSVRQLVTAAGDGAVAAEGVLQYL